MCITQLLGETGYGRASQQGQASFKRQSGEPLITPAIEDDGQQTETERPTHIARTRRRKALCAPSPPSLALPSLYRHLFGGLCITFDITHQEALAMGELLADRFHVHV